MCGGQRTIKRSWLSSISHVGLWGSNSGCQTWQQVPVPSEPEVSSRNPLFLKGSCLKSKLEHVHIYTYLTWIMNSMDRSRVEGKGRREAAVEIFYSCHVGLDLACAA